MELRHRRRQPTVSEPIDQSQTKCCGRSPRRAAVVSSDLVRRRDSHGLESPPAKISELSATAGDATARGHPSSPLKKPPGEGTGPTMHADFRGNLVGRVPSRGERDVFQQTASGARAKTLENKSARPAL